MQGPAGSPGTDAPDARTLLRGRYPGATTPPRARRTHGVPRDRPTGRRLRLSPSYSRCDVGTGTRAKTVNPTTPWVGAPLRTRAAHGRVGTLLRRVRLRPNVRGPCAHSDHDQPSRFSRKLGRRPATSRASPASYPHGIRRPIPVRNRAPQARNRLGRPRVDMAP